MLLVRKTLVVHQKGEAIVFDVNVAVLRPITWFGTSTRRIYVTEDERLFWFDRRVRDLSKGEQVILACTGYFCVFIIECIGFLSRRKRACPSHLLDFLMAG
jgi:hypothetical protein